MSGGAVAVGAVAPSLVTLALIALGGHVAAPAVERLGIARVTSSAVRRARLEGAALALAATLGYHALGGTWPWFVGLFLVPDVALLPYLFGARARGAAMYRATHDLPVALCLLAAGVALASPSVAGIGAIWVSHVGLDRALGYAL